MNIKKLTCIISCIIAFSCNEKVDYYHLPAHSTSGLLNAVIEIPAGTNKKFEYNSETLAFEIDKKSGKERIIQFLPYVGNYGYIPSTLSDRKTGGDGDALDVLVLSESSNIGAVIEIIPIAVLKLIDDGEFDFKIIAIPADKKNQIIKVNTFSEFSSVFPEVKNIIELWFLNYNKDDVAKIDGWGDEKEALLEIEKSLKK